MITAVGLTLGAVGAALIWSAIVNVSLVDEVRAALTGEERQGGGDSPGGGGSSTTW